MYPSNRTCLVSAVAFMTAWSASAGGGEAGGYYAHKAAEDQCGVIAPWYNGLDGQCSLRVRIAAETLKRYPWVEKPATGMPAPHYLYNGRWSIAEDGTITVKKQEPWANGDLGQRSAFAMQGWLNYYRYSGDPAALAHVTMIADLLIAHCETPPDHAWPGFPVSVPVKGESYGNCSPDGMIQLDIAAQMGLGLVRSYQLCGRREWLDHAKHWADLLAAKRNRNPNYPPWNRYANPENAQWGDLQTGGVFMILEFFDELIDLGYTGENNALVEARDAERAYARDVLLSRWTEPDTFGRHYWDWEHPVQCEVSTEVLSRYMMSHPDAFPNWRNDVRNIMTLFVHHACTSVESHGDVYSGAWAYPEGPGCCGRSLWYAPLQVGSVFAEYGVRAGSEWARESARRQFIMATYDVHETGVVEDNIDGGQIVAGGWFKIAHPMPLRFVLDAIAWLPESLGANRENHIVRSSAVVKRVYYNKGWVGYETFDAPANTVDVLRLAFKPRSIEADGAKLSEQNITQGNGYTLKPLPNGDWIVTIRHDGAKRVLVTGDDPQVEREIHDLTWTGPKEPSQSKPAFMSTSTTGFTICPNSDYEGTSVAGTGYSCTFDGNQIRLIGTVGPEGGQADIYLDDAKQLCGVDCWNPEKIEHQVLWYRTGLKPGEHKLKVIATGKRNPRSQGSNVYVHSVQHSAASGDAGFGSGGGPTDRQAWILGYPGREPYVDTKGNSWLPGTEVVVRVPKLDDPIVQTWYAHPKRLHIIGTDDPELYRYGMHAKEFTAYVTTGPGSYRVRLLLMERRRAEAAKRLMDVYVNDQRRLQNLDIAATAVAGQPTTLPADFADKTINVAGMHRAAEIRIENVEPVHGAIAVRLTGVNEAEAVLSAIEVTP